MSEKIVQLNEEVIKGQLKELVRGSVEETLNGLLESADWAYLPNRTSCTGVSGCGRSHLQEDDAYTNCELHPCRPHCSRP